MTPEQLERDRIAEFRSRDASDWERQIVPGNFARAMQRLGGKPMAPTGQLPFAATETPSAKAIVAKFAGQCTACSKPFEVGESVLWTRGVGSKHAKCPSRTISLARFLGRAAA